MAGMMYRAGGTTRKKPAKKRMRPVKGGLTRKQQSQVKTIARSVKEYQDINENTNADTLIRRFRDASSNYNLIDITPVVTRGSGNSQRVGSNIRMLFFNYCILMHNDSSKEPAFLRMYMFTAENTPLQLQVTDLNIRVVSPRKPENMAKAYIDKVIPLTPGGLNSTNNMSANGCMGVIQGRARCGHQLRYLDDGTNVPYNRRYYVAVKACAADPAVVADTTDNISITLGFRWYYSVSSNEG